MTLSVLTIVKDRAGHLDQLVEGLRRSDTMPHELVIVDMGSKVPVRVGDMPFPTRIVRLEEGGLPLAAARNIAAREASGDRLLFLDVDCIPMRSLVGAMGLCLAQNDALICAEVLYLGPDDARGPWDEAALTGCGKRHPVRSFPDSGVRTESNAGLFWSLVFGMSRTRFHALGGFDEAFTGYGAEDTDFGFRARAAGLPLLFMGGAGAFHQYHAVFDPPMQHVEDIVRNARIFRARWNMWPMASWLAAFEQAGLIALSDEDVTLLRRPDHVEMEQARVPAVP